MNIECALNFLAKRSDEAEIFHAKDASKTVEIKKGKMGMYQESLSEGYGFRIIKDKRLGFSFSNELSKKILERALGTINACDKDEYVSLPDKECYKEVKGTFDKRFLEIQASDVLEWVSQLTEPCDRFSSIPTMGGITWQIFEVEILNSHGIEAREKGTLISSYLNAVAKNNELSSGFCRDASRSLDLDFTYIGEEAAMLAAKSLKPKKIGPMETTLILKPYAAAELLQFAFAPSFSADNVQRRRSVLANKIGEELFPGIEVIDDGAIAGGLMSAKFDSEGVKTQKTVLVSKGVLKGFIYDTYTANKGKTKSTGNAERDSYASPPRIGPSNFVLKGKGKIGNGLVVHGLIGCHTANPVSGDFSVETRNAFLNGEPVKAMISGNIFDLLKKCVGFGDDYKQVSFVKCPSIEFSSIKVV